MNCMIFVVFSVAIIAVASVDAENKSGETTEGILDMYNDTSSESGGIPDSHEAMNNRDVHPAKHKTKRSYEFLLGLINNNSRYEVTRTDPTMKLNHQEDTTPQSKPTNELLELLLKLSAHQDQWHRIHKLLRRLDNDISKSKQLLHDLEYQDTLQSKQVQYQTDKRADTRQKNHTTSQQKPKQERKEEEENTWASFKERNAANKGTYNFVERNLRNLQTNKQNLRTGTENAENISQNKIPYRKQFIYHKVTGKPLFVDKPSKAYIAVSVIAPRINTQSKEDANLEKELRGLKPWEHRHLEFPNSKYRYNDKRGF